MARKFIHQRPDGSTVEPEGLQELLRTADERIEHGDGPFHLVINGRQEGKPKTRRDYLAFLGRRIELGDVGDTYRTWNEAGEVQFICREVKVASEVINTTGNKKIDKFWTGLVEKFGKDKVLYMGAYVCKPDSQHRFGNAIDAGNKNNGLITDMAEWAVRNAPTYDLRNVIVKDRWWHIGVGWSHYTGTPHVTHIHADPNPTYDTDLPCGVRG